MRYDLLCHLKEIKNLQTHPFSEIANKMFQFFNNKWKIPNLEVFVAAYLDPRTRPYFPKLEESNRTENDVISYLLNEFTSLSQGFSDSLLSSELLSNSTSSSETSGSESSIFLDFQNARESALSKFNSSNCGVTTEQEFRISLSKAERLILQHVFVNQKSVDNFDPVEFWISKENEHPQFSKIAMKVFIIPPSSVPAESLFKNAGDILTKKRSNLSPDLLNTAVFYRSFLKRSLSS